MPDSPYREQIDKMVWSYSRLHTYRNCPAAFKKQYLDHKPEIENAFAQYGKLCHSILEEYENGNLAEYELLDEYCKRYDKEVTATFPMMRGEYMGDRYYDDGLTYFSQFEGFPPNWEILGAEIDIRFEYEGYSFIGFIDLLVRDKADGKLIVIDHKSKNGFKSISEKREYAIQLYLYSHWVKEHYGEFPKLLVFNTFRKQELVNVPFVESEYQNALSWAVETIHLAEEDIDFWDKIYLQYEKRGEKVSNYQNNDFFCMNLCSCRASCIRGLEGVHT